ITVPRKTPPSRPSTSSRKSVGAHSIAYGPSTRGVVTDRATCHQACSAAPSKNAFSTWLMGALITICTSRPGGVAVLVISGGRVFRAPASLSSGRASRRGDRLCHGYGRGRLVPISEASWCRRRLHVLEPHVSARADTRHFRKTLLIEWQRRMSQQPMAYLNPEFLRSEERRVGKEGRFSWEHYR